MVPPNPRGAGLGAGRLGPLGRGIILGLFGGKPIGIWAAQRRRRPGASDSASRRPARTGGRFTREAVWWDRVHRVAVHRRWSRRRSGFSPDR